jgi:hypothetical protein
MHKIRLVPVLILPLLAGGCLMLPVVEDHVYSTCHALGASGWTALVDYIPDHHNRPIYKPTLMVSGRVTMPGQGYAVSLDLGPVQKLDAPVQQILVRTDAPSGPPSGGKRDVFVRGAFPALKHYGAVTIRCGDGIIGIIKPVPREPKPRR